MDLTLLNFENRTSGGATDRRLPSIVMLQHETLELARESLR